jgi:hypothetical protein
VLEGAPFARRKFRTPCLLRSSFAKPSHKTFPKFRGCMPESLGLDGSRAQRTACARARGIFRGIAWLRILAGNSSRPSG